MSKIPEKVKAAWDDRDDPVILATVDANGIPNIIYVTCVGTFGDERFVVADNYFDKTRRNAIAGGTGAILFRDKSGKAFQIKGALEYHTAGDLFDDMKRWNPTKHPGHAALALCTTSIFSGAERIV